MATDFYNCMYAASVQDRGGVFSCLHELASLSVPEHVSGLIRKYSDRIGFQNFGFAYKASAPRDSGTGFAALLDFPEAWKKRYATLATSSTDSADPVIRHVTTALSPTAWDCRGHVTFTAPSIAHSARGLLGLAGENQLRAGLTIPLCALGVAWSFLVLTTKSTAVAEDVLPELPYAFLFGQGVMACMRRIEMRTHRPLVTLSQRQKEILQWCAIGKTSWEIGMILNISASTVEFHLTSAAQRLHANGRIAACARAVALGLIDV